MIDKRNILEYIEDNGKPYTDSESDFTKGFRMGQQFLKTDITLALELAMARNSDVWKNEKVGSEQSKICADRLEKLDFMNTWIRQNI